MIGQTWKWEKFSGSASALKWNRRDVGIIELLLGGYVAGRSAAIQAGGNLGIFPKALATAFDAVYTFEPDPENFAALMRNAPETNIIKIQAAVGEVPALVAIEKTRRDGKPDSHEGIRHVSNRMGLIPVLRIDDLPLMVCDLLMLDTEGFELFALRGAYRTIQTHRPVICVEINHNGEYYNADGEKVRAYLKDVLRYQFAERWQSDEVWTPCR